MRRRCIVNTSAMNLSAAPRADRDPWRRNFNTYLPEFRCAQRMLDLRIIHRCELKWTVVYYGRRHLEDKLARCIHHLGGMAGEW